MILIDITINLYWTYVESFPWRLSLIKNDFLEFEHETPSPPGVFGIPPFFYRFAKYFLLKTSEEPKNIHHLPLTSSIEIRLTSSIIFCRHFTTLFFRLYVLSKHGLHEQPPSHSLLCSLFFPSFQFSFFAVRISTDNFQVPCIIVRTQ